MTNVPEQVEPLTVKKWLDADEALMVDVREPDEVAAAYIPGTVHMPMSAFDPDKLPDLNGRKLVLQCAGGMRSDQVAQFLLQNGYVDEAVNLVGGIKGWAEAGLPITR